MACTIMLPDNVVAVIDRYNALDIGDRGSSLEAMNLSMYIGERVAAIANADRLGSRLTDRPPAALDHVGSDIAANIAGILTIARRNLVRCPPAMRPALEAIVNRTNSIAKSIESLALVLTHKEGGQ